MLNTPNISGKLAIDSKSIDDLRLQASKDPDSALKTVAKQFEALFVQMMIKSMREATPKDGLFDSQQSQMYTQMLDQQLAQDMSSKGIGLADMMIRQMTRASIEPTHPESMSSIVPNNYPAMGANNQTTSRKNTDVSDLLWATHNVTQERGKRVDTELTSGNSEAQSTSSQSENFVRSLWSHAQVAAEATGIPAHFMIAQAALESGWGKQEIRHADNQPSFNLFGIKAGQGWKGAVVETTTTEYINGAPNKMVEKFRAYTSYAESFQDYANLMLKNPRYAAVLRNQDAQTFAQGLQQAGYATDPHYADKLMRIINSSSIRDHQTI